MSSEVVGFLVALFTGGGIAGLITAISSRRKGIRDADVAEESVTVQGLKDLVTEMRAELTRLKEYRQDDLARIERIEKEIEVEKDLRWLAISHIRDLYSWIRKHLPSADPIPVPDALAPYVHVPRKDTEK